MDSRVVGEKDSCASMLVTTCPMVAAQPCQLPFGYHHHYPTSCPAPATCDPISTPVLLWAPPATATGCRYQTTGKAWNYCGDLLHRFALFQQLAPPGHIGRLQHQRVERGK